MINSINWIDGLDGLSSGVALDRRVTLGPDQPHDAGRPAAHRGPVLRPGRGAARVPALELPPGVDLHRDQRGPVRGLHAGRAVDPGLGQGRRRAARPGRPDHRHVLDHRPARHRRAARRSRPDRCHIHHRLLDLGLSHRRPCCVIYAICASLGLLALLLSQVTQLYAFLGVFVLSGLVLFVPTRGALRAGRRNSRPRRTSRTAVDEARACSSEVADRSRSPATLTRRLDRSPMNEPGRAAGLPRPLLRDRDHPPGDDARRHARRLPGSISGSGPSRSSRSPASWPAAGWGPGRSTSS